MRPHRRTKWVGGFPGRVLKVSDHRELRIRFDGGCSDNGKSGAVATYGWVVTDATTNEVVAKGSGRCPPGPQTNNLAEWWGLVAAVEWVRCLARRPTLTIEGDSKLVIETLTGRWRCKKSHLRTLRERVLAALAPMEWEARWIPRGENHEADALSRPGFALVGGEAEF